MKRNIITLLAAFALASIASLSLSAQSKNFKLGQWTEIQSAIVKELNLNDKMYPAREIKSIISDAKNRLLTAKEWLKEAGGDFRNQKISDMENRLELFNKFPDAVCLSIHQNTYTNPKYSGAQMFYSSTNPESERFAGILQQLFVQNLQPDNTRETKLCGKELYLCYFCDNPTVMAECGFLSNPDEAAKLTDKTYQKQTAYTLFNGIYEFTA
jgi:hypothetical protein